jgi:hypothetical protein
VLPREIAVQLLNLAHKVWREACDLDACSAQSQLTSTTNLLVRVKNADHDTTDPTLDDPLDAGNLRAVPIGTRFQSRVQRRPRNGLIMKLPLQQGVLSMFPAAQLASIRTVQYLSVTNYDRTHEW